MALAIGTPAPDFTLFDQDAAEHTLRNYQGKWVLLYFYPKDDTPGCTTEACSFRDNLPRFANADVTILGISTNSVKSHKKFAEKFGLPFALLADVEKKVVHDYNVWQPKKFMGREYMGTLRTSFLINPEGKIAKVYEHVKPAIHADQVLADLASLQQQKTSI